MHCKIYIKRLLVLMAFTVNVLITYSQEAQKKSALPLYKNTISLNVIGHFDQHALASSIQYERAFIKNKLRIYGNYSLGYFYKDSRSLHFQAYTFGFLFQPKIFGRYSFRIGHNVSLIDEYKINSREDERHWGIGFKIVQVVRLNKHWLVGVDAQTGLYEGRYKYRNGHGSVNFFPAIFLQVGYSF